MLIIGTENVEGQKVHWKFESGAAVLKQWWDEDTADLPGGDDAVFLFIVEGRQIPFSGDFSTLIQELEIEYWKSVV